MDDEDKKRLYRLEELVEENNKMLHRLRNDARWSKFFSLLKWGLIILVSVYSYIQLKPLLGQFQATVETLKNGIGVVENIKLPAGFENLLKK